MPLKVVCFARYLTGSGVTWRPCDHNVHKFVQALKGDSINKYAVVPVRGKKLELKDANADDAIKWFGQLAADYLQENPVKTLFYFVPFPNSINVRTSTKKPRTTKLAQAIIDEAGSGELLDIIRFKKEILSARKGGPRDAQTIYSNLTLIGKVPEKGRIILVDDVMTMGGHLQAARALLEENNAAVKIAICAGRTVLEPYPKCFETIELELDDFDPE